MMKRIAGICVMCIALGAAVPAMATGWGVGGFGGVSIPLVQDDGEQGIVFGGRLKLSLGGMLGVEPHFSYFKNGDWSPEDAPEVTLKGSKFNSIGVNLILGGAGPVKGFRFFPFVGVNYYNEDSDLYDADSKLGWNGGLGLEIGMGNIGIEGRGSFALMPIDGGGSRKWGQITAGLNVYFGVL